MSADLELRLRRGERLTIIGRTGSGKSVALRWVLGAYPRVILADAKGRAHLEGAPVAYGLGELTAAVKRAAGGPFRIIARPGPLEDRADWLDGLCRLAYFTGELCLGVDEIVGIATASRPVRWLEAVLTQGRELGITVVVCTQRPRRIPATVLSEADHLMVYELNRQDDRDAVAELLGAWQPSRVRHGFVYWHGSLAGAVECRPLPFAG